MAAEEHLPSQSHSLEKLSKDEDSLSNVPRMLCPPSSGTLQSTDSQSAVLSTTGVYAYPVLHIYGQHQSSQFSTKRPGNRSFSVSRRSGILPLSASDDSDVEANSDTDSFR